MPTWIPVSSRLLLAALQQPAAAPVAPDSLAPAVVRDTLRLYAVGDLNLGGGEAWRFLLKGDTLYPFQALRDTLAAADITFGNLESAIAPVGHPFEATGTFVFSAPPVAADALAAAGFDVVSNANNHAWDVGLDGVKTTLRELARVGVAHAGTGLTLAQAHRPAIVEREGWRVAFFATTRAYNPAPRHFYTHIGSHYIAYADSGWLYPAIRRLRASGAVDLIVVSAHAGDELAKQPDSALRRFFRGAIAAGADICLGHHPHVLQPVEWYRGRPIVYSMGNFIFHPRAPWTGLSGIFEFTVAPDAHIGLALLPVRAGYQARLATGAAADSVRLRVGPLEPVVAATEGTP